MPKLPDPLPTTDVARFIADLAREHGVVAVHGSEPGLHRLRDLATRHPKRRSVCSAGLPDPAVDHVGVQPMGQSNTAHARSGLAALGQHLGLEVFAVLTAARSPFV